MVERSYQDHYPPKVHNDTIIKVSIVRYFYEINNDVELYHRMILYGDLMMADTNMSKIKFCMLMDEMKNDFGSNYIELLCIMAIRNNVVMDILKHNCDLIPYDKKRYVDIIKCYNNFEIVVECEMIKSKHWWMMVKDVNYLYKYFDEDYPNGILNVIQ